jgi:adenosine deaminase
VGVNIDARTLANVTLSQEYAKFHQTFGWEPQDFYRCNRNALQVTFLPDYVRERVLARLLVGYQQVTDLEG